jgi:hypothetical protein
MPDKKSLSEYTLLELLKMAGKGTVTGIEKGAKGIGKGVMDYSPIAILGKMIGGATAQNPFTTPVGQVGKNMLHGMAAEEGEKALRGVIKKNMDEQAVKDPVGLAETIENIKRSDKQINIQAIQDLIGSSSATENTSSANPSTAVANPSEQNVITASDAGSGSADYTGSANTGSTATAGKKGYGWPIALMMMGKGLQGGNPMDVLSELMANQRLSESQGFEMERLSKLQKFDMEKLEAEYGYKLRNELLKPDTAGNEKIATTNLFQQDLVGMIDAFEQIPMKGNKLVGAAGAIGSVAGLGREARAKYQTLAKSFGYSYGALVWGQQGRALDARENKLLDEITNLKTTQTKGEVLGKVQALIDASNSRARQQGLPVLPDARTLMNQIKQKQSQITSTAPQVTSFKIKE